MLASNRELTEHVNHPLPKPPSRPSPLLLFFSSSFKYDCVYMHLLMYKERSMGWAISLQVNPSVNLSNLQQCYTNMHTHIDAYAHVCLWNGFILVTLHGSENYMKEMAFSPFSQTMLLLSNSPKMLVVEV